MDNPWKGLSSYTEEDLDKYIFAGRSRVTGKLYNLITNNLVVTLYGKTGCGKTSLLQAGLFPLFRQENFLPVMCRPGIYSAGSYSELIIQRTKSEAQLHGVTIEDSTVPMDFVDDSDKYKLWKFFYGHTFFDSEGKVVFPIIVLDQFEEVFLENNSAERQKASCLLEQLSYMVGDNLALPEDSYANFRLVMSLREDFLFLLEDAIEDGNFMLLRDNRLRLSALSNDEAEEIIDLGASIFEAGNRKSISETIIRMSEDRGGRISTNMLSLMCSQIFETYASSSDAKPISEEDIIQIGKEPLQSFFFKCMSMVDFRTRIFIESNLVSNGHRNFVFLRDALKKASKKDLDVLLSGKFKILQITTIGEDKAIELIHDTLARTITKSYNERIALENAEKEQHIKSENSRIKRRSLFAISTEILTCSILSFFWVKDSISLGYGLNCMVFGIAALLLSLFSSIATFGQKRITPLFLIIQFIANIFVLAFITYEIDSDSATWTYWIGFLYLFFIPILNLSRDRNTNGIVPFKKTLEYVFLMHSLRYKPDIKRGIVSCTLFCFASGICFLSGFFLKSWTLWLFLPISTSMIGGVLFNLYGSRQFDLRRTLSAVLPLTVISLSFAAALHINTCHQLLIVLSLALYLIWALMASNLLKRVAQISRLKSFLSLWIICGIIIPIVSSGYNPLMSFTMTRCLSQPSFRYTSGYIPMFSVRMKDGKEGLCTRNFLVFNPNFCHIDSVTVENGDQSIPSICLHTESGEFSWEKNYLDRAECPYLEARIEQLKDKKWNVWSAERISEEAELAAAYRTAGKDSFAESLELDYFIKGLIVKEIDLALEPSPYYPDAKIYEALMTICYHRVSDSLSWEGNYKDDFLAVLHDSPITNDRCMSYTFALYRPSVSVDEFSFYDVASSDPSRLKSVLDSYKETVMPFESFNSAFLDFEDMLYQTRATVGPYMVDSLYSSIYEMDCGRSREYLIGMAWFNIFLERFEKAEKYARASAEVESDDKLAYTNIITSLMLQGKYDDAKQLVTIHGNEIAGEDTSNVFIDVRQYLFPLQAAGYQFSVGTGVVQDINHFMKVGVMRDTLSCEFRKFRKLLSKDFSLPSDQPYWVYDEGFILSVNEAGEQASRKYMLLNSTGEALPLMSEIDVNFKDTVAICRMKNGKYRYLKLDNMSFIGEEYDYAWHFSESLAAVLVGDSIGFIDYDGHYVIQPQFPSDDWQKDDHHHIAFHNGFCAMMDDDNRYRRIDNSGEWYENWTDECSFAYVRYVNEGYIIKSSGKWYACDVNGNYNRTCDKEIGDIVNSRAVYEHFELVDKENSAEDVPVIDVSGVWYCRQNGMFLYLGDYTSDMVCLYNGKCIYGRYYIDSDSKYKYFNIFIKGNEEYCRFDTHYDPEDGEFVLNRFSSGFFGSLGIPKEETFSFVKLRD